MQCALIDIGSNSMRLSVYEINAAGFRTLFREKIMAGLAGFVEKKRLSADGISRAVNGLMQFRDTLEKLGISDVRVFATASLRNIQNTAEAVSEITARTGYAIEVLSGFDEAMFGYSGAMRDVGLETGVFVDIGGASTEIVTFSSGRLDGAVSLPVGSLRLYSDYVKRILPHKGALLRIDTRVKSELASLQAGKSYDTIVGVGGTLRAALKLTRRLYSLPADCKEIDSAALEGLWQVLIKNDRAAIDLILKTEPERVHTIVPGIAILREIVQKYGTQKIIISNYGVREGYLCSRIKPEIPATPKTES
ncbi:MAG: hypothetical protein ACOX81_02715 [Candidatus Heteroscillospira sp.]